MSTIFDSVVTKENDHTNLLRNIMERYPKAAAAVLSYLLDRNVSDVDAGSFEFSTQHPFAGVNGREIPDIFVKGKGFHCIIEAKVDPTLDLTEGQKRGYQGCFLNAGDRYLSFLVPNEWRHSASVEQIRTILPSASTISIHIAHWRELISRLEDVSTSVADTILDEAINFWKWRFQFERMTPQERDSLNTWSDEKYSAIRKLEKTLTQAKGYFDARNFKTELDTSDIDSYGFYIKRGQLYILWIGIWTKAPTPLSFGFHSKQLNWLRPKVLPLAPSTAHNYHLWPLESETWDDPEKLYLCVSSFLQSHPDE